MPRKKAQKKRPNVVSMNVPSEAKAQLDRVCESRGMSIKTFLGQLIDWFLDLNMTEQSIVLEHVEDQDVIGLADMVARRERRGQKRV